MIDDRLRAGSLIILTDKYLWPTPASFCSFQTQILQKNWWRQQDSNSDRRRRRRARWPLDHHHCPILWPILSTFNDCNLHTTLESYFKEISSHNNASILIYGHMAFYKIDSYPSSIEELRNWPMTICLIAICSNQGEKSHGEVPWQRSCLSQSLDEEEPLGPDELQHA